MSGGTTPAPRPAPGGAGGTIAVLLPVLGRPWAAKEVLDTILSSSSLVSDIVFICSPSDKAERRACIALAEHARTLDANWPAGPGDYARKINLGFRATEAEFVFLGADDLVFTPGWDDRALNIAYSSNAGIIGTNDDANPLVKRGRHSTHSLVRRAYVDLIGATFSDGPGVVYHEGYDHQWVDTEMVFAAMKRQQWAFARLSIVEHHHPMYDKAKQMDKTYRKALAHGSEDKALFTKRMLEFRSGS